MRPFHVYLYGRDGGPLGASFDEAAERLRAVEHLLFEPDGSFASAAPGKAGKIERVVGTLYDANGRIQYVDLQGDCGLTHWQRIIRAIDPTLTNQRDAVVVLVLPEHARKNLHEFEQSSFAVSTRHGDHG